ncbi:MAG: bifunctional diguanylate cyclase/phosphodiesterase [Hyphomicrobiales bacterium]|nr:bifunctional diguanylate cyclase/phosphodiesterase [Hyphomicrobiales bacterium]
MEVSDQSVSRAQARPRWRALGGRARPATGERGEAALVRLLSPLALMLVAATLLCWVLGFVLARQADDRVESRNRQALRGAVEALQAAAPDLADVDPKLVRIIENASGLKGLRLVEEPPTQGREVQSLLDAKGRIVGWFTWEAERPATAMVVQLLPFGAAVAIGLLGFAILALWRLRRLGSLLLQRTREVHRLAYEDTATGLPNLHRMRATVDAMLAVRREEEQVAVALLDLGGLDEMKEAAGDAGEDAIAAEIAERLRREVPEGGHVARLRGDRFAVILRVDDADEALALVQAMRDSISRAFWVDQVIQLSASAGLALAPRDGASREELIRRAELALRLARQRGRALVVRFSPDMERDFDERLFIKRELSRALATRSFDLHYQPIVKADGGGMAGVEALLRWNHPERGFIPPDLFVRVAEEAGLMDQLGELVLRRAIADAARWPSLYMGVNLSPVQVRDRRFLNLMRRLLAESGIEPSRLVLEITEGVLIDDPTSAKARLEDLRRLGVQLALDDFGSGYSSLSYLQQLPFDKLKIDRGFVAALDQSANAGVIIQAIVTLGRALGMSVVIEGVETEAQRVLLRLAGCNEMQGYLFARPAPAETIDRLVAAGAALPSSAQRDAG